MESASRAVFIRCNVSDHQDEMIRSQTGYAQAGRRATGLPVLSRPYASLPSG